MDAMNIGNSRTKCRAAVSSSCPYLRPMQNGPNIVGAQQCCDLLRPFARNHKRCWHLLALVAYSLKTGQTFRANAKRTQTLLASKHSTMFGSLLALVASRFAWAFRKWVTRIFRNRSVKNRPKFSDSPAFLIKTDRASDPPFCDLFGLMT